jgi:hypothetical protein
MLHRQTRIERAAEGRFPFWVVLAEEKCTGANFEKHQDFCRTNGLAVSNYSPAVAWKKEWYCVFRFAQQEHADLFMKEFGGEPMHPSERGKIGRNGRRAHTSRNLEALTISQSENVAIEELVIHSWRIK